MLPPDSVKKRKRRRPTREADKPPSGECRRVLSSSYFRTDTQHRDQELRFTVHESPDYHQLKVSVFNDDKKTELIGETWVSLDAILNPGGGQSDSWHSLNCKGKYAGEIRIELTYYDTRPKPEKPVVEKKSMRALADGQSPSLSGPRENTPVKRRPLPSDPTGTSPSPVTTPSAHLRMSAGQSGPRSYGTPRHQSTPTHQPRSHHPDQPPTRRPVPDSAGLIPNPVPSSHQGTPTHHVPQAYNPPPAAPAPVTQLGDDGFDMSYTAPKPYEVQPIDPLPQHVREPAPRTMSHDDYRPPHSQNQLEYTHSRSAPVIPTQQAIEYEQVRQDPYTAGQYHQSPEPYEEPSNQVAPLRLQHRRSRTDGWGNDQYQETMGHPEPQNQYDPFISHGRRVSAMQPTVEDEDDMPPPPPVHRSDAMTVPQPHQHHPQHVQSYQDDTPAPLNIARYRGEPSYGEYDGYNGIDEFSDAPSGLQYTHPRNSPQPTSRPVSRDAMVPSPLRQETTALPSSLIPGYDPHGSDRVDHSHYEDQMSLVRRGSGNPQQYQVSPLYEDRQRLPIEYQTPPEYETPPRHYPGIQQALPSTESPAYYQHSSPQEPQHMSAYQDPAPLIKPRAVSPVESRQVAERARAPVRSMPTRKSVSPRPPPTEQSERRLSSVAFSPDDFNVLNPNMNESSLALERRNSGVEINEKGQVVTFSGRVVDASDHLPVDNWAPEPEPKGTQKERTPRERTGLNGARDFRDSDVEAARQRERERKERLRIRNAVNATIDGSPSNALVSRHQASSSMTSNVSPGAMVVASRHHYTNSLPRSSDPYALPDLDSPGSAPRNKLQKRDKQRPISSYNSPTTHSSPAHGGPSPSNVLRERENIGGYTGSPGYNRHSVAAPPPIPAKIPIEDQQRGYGGGMEGEDDLLALSRELQSIDIGGTGRGRGGGTAQRRRYGGGGNGY